MGDGQTVAADNTLSPHAGFYKLSKLENDAVSDWVESRFQNLTRYLSNGADTIENPDAIKRNIEKALKGTNEPGVAAIVYKENIQNVTTAYVLKLKKHAPSQDHESPAPVTTPTPPNPVQQPDAPLR